MINFTVGPVQSDEYVRDIGAENTPYFRTAEFSQIMLENEHLMNEFIEAGDGARTVFITGSGTAAMEAAVMNTLTASDKALVVNGGSFGARFAKLCHIHGIGCTEIKLEPGQALTGEILSEYDNRGYTAFLVNMCETSTGVLYDMNLISSFCQKNGLFLIVDAVSAFIANEIHMSAWGIDVVITASQKALAVPPGVSIVMLGKRALERVYNNECSCMYFDIKDMLTNGERGQTPFTPAVTTLLQINARLRRLKEIGFANETRRIAEQAADFRSRLTGLPFEYLSQSPANSVTALKTVGCSAGTIFNTLKDEYGIWICPNGGEMADTVFRVGHIGALTHEDNAKLVEAFHDLIKRNII